MERPLTGDELDLLRWLSEADTSALGECKGASLDTLVARGLVAIAHRVPVDYSRVSLTEPGWSFFRIFLEEGGPADADTTGE